jgi:hypothetical protein
MDEVLTALHNNGYDLDQVTAKSTWSDKYFT